MDNYELAVALAKADSEQAVIGILEKANVWNDYSYWHPFGDNSNNYSIIGNQQSTADAAFVEKIINSIDACLCGECLKRGISPAGTEAPQSIEKAVEQFFGVEAGSIMDMDPAKRTALANNIVVAATGKTRGGDLNLCIADRGEGQTPKKMPETILSISKSNKLKIPFVQGKFNMGGTGVLPFCGENRLQLIISKRCPAIPNTDNDEMFDKWSVTVIRREAAREGRKSSMYTYLSLTDGGLFTFEASSLNIIPKEKTGKTEGIIYEDMEYGTFIKLYNYALDGYRASISLDFYYRISLLVPNLALPVRFRDSRNFSAHTNAVTVAGIVSRLYNDRNDVLEEGFPSSSTFVVDNQSIRCSVYLFKKDKQAKFRGKHEGILFSVNGQTQGIIADKIFDRVNLGYLQNSILVIVDCSNIDIAHQEEMFMTSRDRTRNTAFFKELQGRVEKELREHKGLKKYAEERRKEALKDKIADNKPLKEVLSKILKKSNALTKLFSLGREIDAPSDNQEDVGTKDKFKGEYHPTFFQIAGKLKEGKLIKEVPVNWNFRVQFRTDAQNDYFSRPGEPGEFALKINGKICNELIEHLSLYNGVATLTARLPEGVKIGSEIIYEAEVKNVASGALFKNDFTALVRIAQEKPKGGKGGRKKPIDNAQQGKQKNQNGYAMPEIIAVRKEDWAEYGMNGQSALQFQQTDNGGDYFLNMDNDYLLAELKGIKAQSEIELAQAQFKYSMALIGMSIISYYKNASQEEESRDISEEVKNISSMVAPVLIPMLNSIASLSLEEIGVRV